MTYEQEEVVIEYLKRNTPETWHLLVRAWNWDYGREPLYWLVRNPLCDKGTILLMYWLNCPRWYAQYADESEVANHEWNSYCFIKEIEKKYVEGFYSSANFAFNPANDEGCNYATDYEDKPLKTPIPQIMYQPIEGKILERPNYPSSLPQEIWDEFEKLEE